ncbi:MAG: hypothetical protein WCS73_05285 [Lentisphaeria bacterium]
MYQFLFLLLPFLFLDLLANELPGVDVSTYLYAKTEQLTSASGQLIVFLGKDFSPNLRVIAYGRKYRKDRKSREGEDDSMRERYKPFLAILSPNEKTASFSSLPVDFYDLLIIDSNKMNLYEGIALNKLSNTPQLSSKDREKYIAEMTKTLFPTKDKIGGWEGFFDHKEISRVELSGPISGIFLQQLRLGKSQAESGRFLDGCIHSIDIVWLERSKEGVAGWKVLNRQQLYRKEITSKKFFNTAFLPTLQGIRVSTRPRKISVTLP